ARQVLRCLVLLPEKIRGILVQNPMIAVHQLHACPDRDQKARRLPRPRVIRQRTHLEAGNCSLQRRVRIRTVPRNQPIRSPAGKLLHHRLRKRHFRVVRLRRIPEHRNRQRMDSIRQMRRRPGRMIPTPRGHNEARKHQDRKKAGHRCSIVANRQQGRGNRTDLLPIAWSLVPGRWSLVPGRWSLCPVPYNQNKAMKCPYCGFAQDRVVDSRESKEAESIRRRRECERCNKRFTTYERIDEIPYMVVKKDGRREKFERQKVLSGLLHACEKRPVSTGDMEQIVDETEAYVVDSPERERSTSEVGEQIMARLKDIDTVAYIRFASVYRDFKDVREFKAELEELLSGKDSKKRR